MAPHLIVLVCLKTYPDYPFKLKFADLTDQIEVHPDYNWSGLDKPATNGLLFVNV